MRRLTVLLFSITLALAAQAKDVYLSVGGSANGFFTDARILNPSFDKDITITARYLPAGNSDNSNVTPKEITVAKRSMAVYDDVVNSLFGGGPALGAIRLTSDDDFVATQRIYADKRTAPQAGTLGQFVPGLDASAAKIKGSLIQLKSGASALGTFRTNWGGVNPNNVIAHVTMILYDKANAVVGTPFEIGFPPYAVVAPANILQSFGNPSNDLGDAWISFTSDQPVFLYASVVDNGSTDPTFVPASDDSGVAPVSETKIIDVNAFNSSYTITFPNPRPKKGDTVKFVVHSTQDTHGFRLISPSDVELITIDPVTSEAVERTITLTEEGTYLMYCTHTGCSPGHQTMNKTFDVGHSSDPPDGGYE
jgi:hypothetical protein